LVAEGESERVNVGDLVTERVLGCEVARVDLVIVKVVEEERLGLKVLETDTEFVLVNGLVVGIPERVTVKDVERVLVTVTDLVYEGDDEGVFRAEGATVTRGLELLVNGSVVGIPERVMVKDVERVLVTLTVLVNE
jgi:hypothetical protein